MHNFKKYTSFIGVILAAMSLISCGGSSGGNTATSNAPQSQLTTFSCSGAVKNLFTAAQGTYSGVVDPAFVAGAGAALTVGTVYPVTLSGQDCSIRFTGNNNTQFVFAYNDPSNVSASQLVGFAPKEVVRQPEALDLEKNQYNLSIAGQKNTIELERRVAQDGVDTVTGDLHIFAIPGPNSFGGMHLKLNTKR